MWKKGLEEINCVEQYVLHSLEFAMYFLSFKAPLSERNYLVFNVGEGAFLHKLTIHAL